MEVLFKDESYSKLRDTLSTSQPVILEDVDHTAFHQLVNYMGLVDAGLGSALRFDCRPTDIASLYVVASKFYLEHITRSLLCIFSSAECLAELLAAAKTVYCDSASDTAFREVLKARVSKLLDQPQSTWHKTCSSAPEYNPWGLDSCSDRIECYFQNAIDIPYFGHDLMNILIERECNRANNKIKTEESDEQGSSQIFEREQGDCAADAAVGEEQGWETASTTPTTEVAEGNLPINLSNSAKIVHRYLQEQVWGSEGANLEFIADRVSLGIDETRRAVWELADFDLAFPTIDDNTWAAFGSSSKGPEQATCATAYHTNVDGDPYPPFCTAPVLNPGTTAIAVKDSCTGDCTGIYFREGDTITDVVSASTPFLGTLLTGR